ncbi:hypothetical protein ES703_93222 [subsurface metagenome]
MFLQLAVPVASIPGLISGGQKEISSMEALPTAGRGTGGAGTGGAGGSGGAGGDSVVKAPTALQALRVSELMAATFQ